MLGSAGVARSRVDSPPVGDTLEFVLACRLEGEAAARDKVFDGLREEHLRGAWPASAGKAVHAITSAGPKTTMARDMANALPAVSEAIVGHFSRTVTHTWFVFAVTPVGRYGMLTRVTASVRGSIRHSVPSRGVVAQTKPAPTATFQTPAPGLFTGRGMLRGLGDPTAWMRTTCGPDQSPAHTVSPATAGKEGLFAGCRSTTATAPVLACSLVRLPVSKLLIHRSPYVFDHASAPVGRSNRIVFFVPVRGSTCVTVFTVTAVRHPYRVIPVGEASVEAVAARDGPGCLEGERLGVDAHDVRCLTRSPLEAVCHPHVAGRIGREPAGREAAANDGGFAGRRVDPCECPITGVSDAPQSRRLAGRGA